MRSRESGFTLVELAIVIAVTVIMVGSVIVSSSAMKREAVVDSVAVYVADFQRAMQRFMTIHGRIPSSLSDGTGNVKFVPNFLLDPYTSARSNGFDFIEYISSDSRCSNKATLILDVFDDAAVEELKRKLNICRVDNNTKIVVYLTP